MDLPYNPTFRYAQVRRVHRESAYVSEVFHHDYSLDGVEQRVYNEPAPTIASMQHPRYAEYPFIVSDYRNDDDDKSLLRVFIKSDSLLEMVVDALGLEGDPNTHRDQDGLVLLSARESLQIYLWQKVLHAGREVEWDEAMQLLKPGDWGISSSASTLIGPLRDGIREPLGDGIAELELLAQGFLMQSDIFSGLELGPRADDEVSVPRYDGGMDGLHQELNDIERVFDSSSYLSQNQETQYEGTLVRELGPPVTACSSKQPKAKPYYLKRCQYRNDYAYYCACPTGFPATKCWETRSGCPAILLRIAEDSYVCSPDGWVEFGCNTDTLSRLVKLKQELIRQLDRRGTSFVKLPDPVECAIARLEPLERAIARLEQEEIWQKDTTLLRHNFETEHSKFIKIIEEDDGTRLFRKFGQRFRDYRNAWGTGIDTFHRLIDGFPPATLKEALSAALVASALASVLDSKGETFGMRDEVIGDLDRWGMAISDQSEKCLLRDISGHLFGKAPNKNGPWPNEEVGEGIESQWESFYDLARELIHRSRGVYSKQIRLTAKSDGVTANHLSSPKPIPQSLVFDIGPTGQLTECPDSSNESPTIKQPTDPIMLEPTNPPIFQYTAQNQHTPPHIPKIGTPIVTNSSASESRLLLAIFIMAGSIFWAIFTFLNLRKNLPLKSAERNNWCSRLGNELRVIVGGRVELSRETAVGGILDNLRKDPDFGTLGDTFDEAEAGIKTKTLTGFSVVAEYLRVFAPTSSLGSDEIVLRFYEKVEILSRQCARRLNIRSRCAELALFLESSNSRCLSRPQDAGFGAQVPSTDLSNRRSSQGLPIGPKFDDRGSTIPATSPASGRERHVPADQPSLRPDKGLPGIKITAECIPTPHPKTDNTVLAVHSMQGEKGNLIGAKDALPVGGGGSDVQLVGDIIKGHSEQLPLPPSDCVQQDDTSFNVCEICGVECSNVGNLNRHKRSHFPSLDSFQCPYPLCTRKFTRKHARDKHMKSAHNIVARLRYNSTERGVDLGNVSATGSAFLETGSPGVYGEGLSPIGPVAGFCVSDKKRKADPVGDPQDHLAERLQPSHSIAKRARTNQPIECEVCNKQFSKVSNYNRHRPVHFSGLDRFVCRYLGCNETFTRKHAREKHESNRRLHPIPLPNK